MENRNFKNYIQNFISLTFLITIIVFSIIAYFTIKKVAYPILLSKEYENIRNIGNSIVLELRNKIKNAETLSLTEANIYKLLEKKKSVFIKIIPNFLNLSGYENIIAGGGIWPEPYTFSKKDFYRSFFWGRDKNGILKYYNDYNNPSGKGYFHEEWYVPVKFLDKSKVYWSRSYIDPYSKQPMVTCTSPIIDNKKFLGVATVDLKLEGLEKLFSQYAKKVNGYIFVLDRENNFLYFPKGKTVRWKGSFYKKYINLSEFTKRFPRFSIIKNKIESMDYKFINLARQKNSRFDKIADKISEESYQISKQEAVLITTILTNPLKLKLASNLESFKVEKDMIFNEPAICTIIYMPGTYWKIGVVVTEKLMSNLVNQISWRIISNLFFPIIFILLIGYFLIRHNLLVPLKKITLELLNPHDKEDFYINYSSNNELGRLVYYFNKRTRELKESEAYSKAIFEQSPVPIQIFDKKGIAIDANKAWENMWGMDKRDFNGKYNIFRDKIFKNSKEFKYIHDVFNGKPYIIKKFEYKLKTVANIGRDRILNVIMFPIKDTNSNIVRVVVIQEDITDKVKMEESIQRIGQLEALGELSAGVAHDFNNILTGMVLNLEMLEIKLKGNREAIRFINKIKISMDSAKNLIHKIRMVSRREEHKMFPCKLNEILKESLDIIKPAISSNIDLKVHILGNHFWIECDKNSINQLIMNLIINARDAIKTAERSNGLIEITLKEENNFIILKVSDNGIGIPEEIKERIFEPFFSTKQKTEHRGTGLGLSIVFNIVIMHKGEIAVKSEVGKGTTFTVKFYLLDYQIDDRKEDKKNIRLNKSLYNKTVLLVEDEDNVSEAESEILKYLGFKVVNAKNGKEAVDIVKSSEKIDIVLIDWDMPIMNGEKAILDIRKINQTIPIFIVSGAISERMEKFKNSGLITEIINKPFKKDEIIEKFNFYIN